MGENPLDMAKGRVETEHICYGLPTMTCISKALRDVDVMSACRERCGIYEGRRMGVRGGMMKKIVNHKKLASPLEGM